jgi:hypothetical protein
LESFQSLGIDLDEAEHEAAESLPHRASLPDVAHLVGLIELMGAVYEERAPFSLLREELTRRLVAYRHYQEHLEKVYEGQSDHPDLESLLVAAEELGESLSLLDRALAGRDASRFPAVWESIAGPAQELHRLASGSALDELTPAPETALPPFFAELRQLWSDRLARRLSGGEFVQALTRAHREIQKLERFALATPEAAGLSRLLAELSSLTGGAFTEPDFADLERIEKLGQDWSRLAP